MTIEQVKSEVDQISREYFGNRALPYRDAKPNVDESDFFIATKCQFTNTGMSVSEFEQIEADCCQSDSGSRYKVVDGVVYRCSDHWGRVASCQWDLDSHNEGRYTVAACNISNMQANDRSGGFVIVNPELEQMKSSSIHRLQNLLGFASGKKSAVKEIEKAIKNINSK